MTDYSFQTLHSDGGARVIFRGVVGSRAYGTDRPGSDEDVRGVFLVPPIEYALVTTTPRPRDGGSVDAHSLEKGNC